MKNIYNAFKITKKDIIAIRKSRSRDFYLKENFPILYKIKSYFTQNTPKYTTFTKEDLANSHKNIKDNELERKLISKHTLQSIQNEETKKKQIEFLKDSTGELYIGVLPNRIHSTKRKFYSYNKSIEKIKK